MKTPHLIRVIVALISFIGVCNSAHAISASQSQIETMKVPLYKSYIASFNRSIKKISVGNPDIADILIMRDREVYVRAFCK